MRRKLLPLSIGVFLFSTVSYSQVTTNTTVLQRAQREASVQQEALNQRVLKLAAEKGWPLRIGGKNGRVAILVDVDAAGYPLYAEADNNILSAATIKTNQLWPGGTTGLNLSASSANIKSKIGIWDGGNVRGTHVELTGRVVQKDNTSTGYDDHATHVAGTLIASGVNAVAKGMSFGAQQLIAYDFNNHLPEMLGEASGLLVSNHSYSSIAGWRLNTDQSNRWEFWGDAGATEDYKFGYYSSEAQVWDSIAYNAPNYLIVKAAGNNRDENGPAVGQPYWRFNTSGTMVSSGNRPAGISNNDTFDIISTYGTAKNVLTVGAINPIPGGYSNVADAVLTGFSSWGPTDDGRIKPDVVADGANLLSSIATSDNAYAAYSGTSMASPSAAGSLFLLQEYYSKLHGTSTFMRSATLKGIVIHTADEAGAAPGPDYKYGWGVINMEKAAAVITSNNTDKVIEENVLTNGSTYTKNVVASGKGSLVVTLSWTDVKGTVDNNTATRLNNPAIRLVNDLDIRVTRASDNTVYMPWILNPAKPNDPATTGDNIRDNIEKIEIPNTVPGETYVIKVTHKNTLDRAQQAYSLLISGVGGTAYCTSAPTSSAGARIDNVTLGTLNNTNVAGCTTYSNFTTLIDSLQQGGTIPFSIAISNCDATGATDKIVKIFIDYNNNGVFTDAGEEVAVSGVLNAATATFTGSITVPTTVSAGALTRMRIIVQQTSTASAVVSCGTYGNGETQDYSVRFINPSKDVAISELITPVVGACPGEEFITVRIKNYGSAAVSAIPISVNIKNGATDLGTLTFTYPNSIPAYGNAVYTFQAPLRTVAANTYTITSKTILTGDQNPANDQLVSTIAVNSLSPAITGTATKCGTSQVTLKANTTGNDVAVWYADATSTTPLAYGANTSTTTITGNNTYYLSTNDGATHAGPANKLLSYLGTGGYNAFAGNFVRVNNSVPLTINTARLYIANAGKIKFTLANLATFSSTTGGYSYYPLYSTTIDVYPTTPTPQAGAVSGNNASDTGAVYYLGLPVTDAGDHIIIVECLEGANIFRNNAVTGTNYPFSIPNVFSITGNSATVATADSVNYYKGFYYFLYDVAIKLNNCPGTRVPIVAGTATAPTATQSGNILTASSGSAYQWYLNGSAITNAIAQSYNVVASGDYYVVVTDASGCAQASNHINVVYTATVDVNGTEIALKASPNPTKGRFTLQFEVKTKDDLSIDVLNAVGQTVYRKTYGSFIGQFTEDINPGKLSSGMYILRIQHGQKTYIKKLLVE
ncbi:MAG: S8 family serine peptidase [Chitinophagaceae bacterium]